MPIHSVANLCDVIARDLGARNVEVPDLEEDIGSYISAWLLAAYDMDVIGSRQGVLKRFLTELKESQIEEVYEHIRPLVRDPEVSTTGNTWSVKFVAWSRHSGSLEAHQYQGSLSPFRIEKAVVEVIATTRELPGFEFQVWNGK
jgi:hypothetical protein